VIENTEFSEKSRLFDFICQIKQAAFFICQSGYSQSDPDSAYATLNCSF